MTSSPETITAAARPGRPDLFAKSAIASQPAQRISVLASLNTAPAPVARKSHRPIWLAISSVCVLAGLLAYYLQAPEALSPFARTTEQAPAPEAIPASPPPVAQEMRNAPALAEEDSLTAPATIEMMQSEEESLSALAPPLAEVSAPAATQASIPAAPLAVAAPATEGNNSRHPNLISALAEAPKSKAHKKKKPSTSSKKQDQRVAEAYDTDVLLLEALVSSQRRKPSSARPAEPAQ